MSEKLEEDFATGGVYEGQPPYLESEQGCTLRLPEDAPSEMEGQ